MPSMDEIYERHSLQYDELVNAEDEQGNLPRFLLSAVTWSGRRVLEAGTGTGRVTRIYVPHVKEATCFDRSAHMLQAASSNLGSYRERLSFMIGENTNLPHLPDEFDVFIEGWSFGHSIVDSTGPVEAVADRLLESACRNLSDAAELVLIETMGTNTQGPEAPHERLSSFYAHIEEKRGFSRQLVMTDYKFPSVEEAARIMGFFFGAPMHDRILSQQQALIPEWTGVWICPVRGLHS